MRQELLINDQWQFAEMPLGTSLSQARENGKWQNIDVPHDWLIYDPNDLYRSGEGWYRRTLRIEKKQEGKCFLRFEGVYQDCTVFLNSQKAGEWKYGYTTFEIDISALCVPGDNELMVRCVYESPNSRWYSGAGIYRNVYLKYAPPAYFASDGIYVTTFYDPELDWEQTPGRRRLKGRGERMRVEIDSELHLPAGAQARICHKIYAPDGTLAAEIGEDAAGCRDERKLFVKEPVWWSPEHPALYTLVSTLLCGGESHQVTQKFGFRVTSFDPTWGFLLNGEPVKLRGVCLHHDQGALGSAVNREAIKRQLSIMKEMGVNAIRTSHNPPAVELMELCDEMGLLMDSEIFDMWEIHKTEYDYASHFPAWAKTDVAAWVRRDRNHPCVIMWSVGNEIGDTNASERGQAITAMLRDAVRENDPKHHAPCTIASNYMAWENGRKCADLLELAGYNYGEALYEKQHAEHPDWVIYGSETFSMVQSRGIYHFPLSAPILAEDDLQCSALGNSNTSWGAKSYEKCVTDDRDAEYCLGQFIWTGFDYIGEPTPYHTKNSYFGLTDTAGFPKDAYYVFKAEWTDVQKAPFVHVFPYWDFNEGQLIDVQAVSNAPRIRLLLNGRVIGEKEIDHKHGLSLIGKWQLPYEKGVLRAEALDEKGTLLAWEEKRSFGDGVQIVLKARKDRILANGLDLNYIEITVTDQDGIPVENANNRVRVSVQGPGRLVGLDNGDSTDYDSWKGDSRRLFSGKLLAIVAAEEEAGDITVTVSGEGLRSASLSFPAEKAEKLPGISCSARNVPSPENREIPIRKLTLAAEKPLRFTPENREIAVSVSLSPVNASYDDLIWRVVTEQGVDTPLAVLDAQGHRAVIRAVGDGRFYIRCMACNGAPHPRILSQLECTAEGFGPVLLDPYAFVSGSLLALTRGEIGPGNERGFSTAPDAESMVAFESLDFGEEGADTFTISVFTLNDDAYPFELYDGDPLNGGKKVLSAVYQKHSIWNTYQEETYRLSRPLRGVRTLWLAAHQKMHVKGFIFRK